MRFFLAPLCALLLAALVVANPVRSSPSLLSFAKQIAHSHFNHRFPRRTPSGERLSSRARTPNELIEELCGCYAHFDHVSCRCRPFSVGTAELTITSRQPLLTGPCTVGLRVNLYFTLGMCRYYWISCCAFLGLGSP